MDKKLIKVNEEKIQGHYKNINSLLDSFRTTQYSDGGVRSGSTRLASAGALTRTSSSAIAGSRESTVVIEIRKTLTGITPDDNFMTQEQHTVLLNLRRGLAIASEVSDLFSQHVGLPRLKEENANSRLNQEETVRFKELQSAGAIIAGFVFSNYMRSQLGQQIEGSLSDAYEVMAPEKLELTYGGQACKDLLAGLSTVISTKVQSNKDLLPFVVSYFDACLDMMLIRRENMTHLNSYENCTYLVEQEKFEISGFERSNAVKSSDLNMVFKKPHEVIGNAIAKQQAMRLARMLVAYDFTEKKNPFAELGGFIFTFMGDGNPGTGKTTLIQMMCGLLKDYCDVAGYPFRYRNFSTEDMSSYQSESGRNAKAFVNEVLDPNVIGYGTIDDIDQIAGKRGDKQSSAGQQEVTAVLMETFAGANTVVRGNTTFGMFSNFPENVDDALRQRASARFLIDGPQTREDFIDILALLLGNNHEIETGNVDLFATQDIESRVKDSYTRYNQPSEPQLLEVYNTTVAALGELNTLEKVGTYMNNIKEADGRFTGRAIKNITDAAKVRAMDFEMPDEWFVDPSLFLHKSYKEKLEMLKALREPITPEMLLQETNRYADSEFRYANKSDNEAINAKAREMRQYAAAKDLYESGENLD